jgi:DNA primase
LIYKRAVIKALKSARVRYQEGGRMVHTWCPFHPDRETPSLVIYTNRDPVRWYCFGCRAHGFWDKLAEALKTGDLDRDWDDPQAFKHISHSLKRMIAQDPALPPLTRPWTYGQWREFSGQSLAKVHARWWYDEIDKVRRILWPVWDPEGELVGWVARDMDNRAEGRKYRNMPRMEALQTLWPIPVHAIYPERRLVLVEGITDALRLLAEGIPALANLGTAWSPARTALVQSRLQAERIVLAFDPDTPGQQATYRVGHALKASGAQIDVWKWSEGHDPGDAPIEEVNELRKEVMDPRTPEGSHPWIRLGPRSLPVGWLP